MDTRIVHYKFITRVNPKYPVTYQVTEFSRQRNKRNIVPTNTRSKKTKNEDILLVDHIVRRRGRKVLIRWLGYGPEHDTWEDMSPRLSTAQHDKQKIQ